MSLQEPSGKYRDLILDYYNSFRLRISSGNTTLEWIKLEKGIITPCTITVILFAAEDPSPNPVIDNPPSGLHDNHIIPREQMDPEGSGGTDHLGLSLVLKKGKSIDKYCFTVGSILIPSISEKPAFQGSSKPGFTSTARKWLGLPRSLSNIPLYGKNMLKLPISSLIEEFLVTRTRKVLQYQELSNPKVSQASIQVRTGRKWKAAEASRVLAETHAGGHMTCGRAGLGRSTKPRYDKAKRGKPAGVYRSANLPKAVKCGKLKKQEQHLQLVG
ncbi:hypothetical protein N1851_013951 [Merluccius polli]|uniref:Uncharacterized protein n=1 Tax=Merluccius polli TaxID=89951 RepID=A0AA47MUF4_MERPO|nr:hypothetical protein N1851_013951 [Merluccius polli]